MEKEVKLEKKVTPKKTSSKKSSDVKTKIDPKTGTLKVVEKKKTTKKEEPKKVTKTTTSKKGSTKKTTTKKTSPKKVKKQVEEKIEQFIPVEKLEQIEETTNISTPVNQQTSMETIEQPEKVQTSMDFQIEEELDDNTIKSSKGLEQPKKRGRKPSDNPLPKKSAKELTIEPPKREPKVDPKKEEKKVPKEPEIIVRPTPKKTKVLTKEEKVLYKKLQESFNYVANFTNIVEERTMDLKLIPDLTVGELHVIEMVDQNNNKPMTLIAKKLKVTVGSLTICINRLVQKGYLLRIRHEMDHRIILVSITQKGKKVLKAHDLFHENILGLVLEGITLQQAVKVMTQFAMVLENYYDPKTIVTTSTKKKGSN